MLPVWRPRSTTRSLFSALTLILIAAPKLSRRMLLMMTGCAPRTKIEPVALEPRPKRSAGVVLKLPESLNWKSEF
jgi:hypothetical protein